MTTKLTLGVLSFFTLKIVAKKKERWLKWQKSEVKGRGNIITNLTEIKTIIRE
jgi:hypothetical protein